MKDSDKVVHDESGPKVAYQEFVSRHIDLSIEIADLRERVEAIEAGAPGEAKAVEFSAHDVVDPSVTRWDMIGMYFGLRRQFADWLAFNGYGIDYAHETDPPIALPELAEAYRRLEGREGGAWEGEALEDYENTITESTGAYSKEATL